MAKLNDKQEMFCNEYLIDLNVGMVVYMVTNKISKKSYIGITTGKLNRRIKNHFSSAKRKDDIKYDKRQNGRKFFNAIRKYPTNSWHISVLDFGKTLEELTNKEIHYIAKHSTFNTGYNETKGGEGRLGMTPWNKGLKGVQTGWNKGIKATEESKKRQSEIMMGHKGMSGEKNPMYGKLPKNSRKVIAKYVNTNVVIGIYDSIKKAADQLPISHGSVKKILSGTFSNIKGIKVQYHE